MPESAVVAGVEVALSRTTNLSKMFGKCDMEKLIVLGAGRPFSGQQHAVLRGASSRGRVLDWLLQAVSRLSLDVHFVGGYQLEEISSRYPSLQYTLNPEWETTGAAASLLSAPIDSASTLYVSYSDVLFRESAVLAVAEADSDVVVAIDSEWRHRFSGRSEKDIARCEKVNVVGDRVTRLGHDISPNLADAEFVGLVKLSAAATAFLKSEVNTLYPMVQKSNLSYLLEVLRTKGFSVRAVDVVGDWAELNEPRDLTHFIMGTKAQTLHRLQGLVTNSRIEDQVSFTVAEWDNGAKQVIDRIQTAFPDENLVIRSSALSEDGFTSANAGAYTSILNVDVTDEPALRSAIVEVVGSYPDGNIANQVLVQPMVEDVRVSGVAFTRTLAHGAPYYVVNYDDLTQSTDSITSGASRDHKTLLVHRNGSSRDDLAPASVRNLLPALREIEDLLDYDSLDIEFAISASGMVHILQVRPIAVNHDRSPTSDDEVASLLEIASQRFQALQFRSPFVVGESALFGVMPDWNPAEIIGTKPGRLAMGLYRYLIMDEIWATQRAEYGYRDVRPQPLLVAFAGHPYVDIRASFNSFVPANVDDELAGRLVDFYLEWLRRHPHLHDKVEFDVVPTCFALDFERWEQRLSIEGSFSAKEIHLLRDGLKAITLTAIERTEQDLRDIDRLESRFQAISQSELPSLERALVLLEDCRRYGTLPFSHLARSAFVAVTLLKSAVERQIISQAAMDAFLNSIRTVTHRFTEDAAATAEGSLDWDIFVSRYGHLRPGTYDITSPSYHENPDHFLAPVVERARGKQEPHTAVDGKAWLQERSNFGRALAEVGLEKDLDKLEQFMRNAIEGREYAKFAFTRHLSAALDAITDFGAGHDVTREDLGHIALEAFWAVRSGGMVTGEIGKWLHRQAQEGRQAQQQAKVIELPPLIMEDSEFHLFLYPSNQANFVGSGRVTASSVDLSAHSSAEPPNLAGKIALIPQADPGYDWLFGQEIAGLVTMYGGANSHMAIRAAEFGLPAAIGVGETQYGRLARATVLELDAANRLIQVIQ